MRRCEGCEGRFAAIFLVAAKAAKGAKAVFPDLLSWLRGAASPGSPPSSTLSSFEGKGNEPSQPSQPSQFRLPPGLIQPFDPKIGRAASRVRSKGADRPRRAAAIEYTDTPIFRTSCHRICDFRRLQRGSRLIALPNSHRCNG